MLVLHTWEYRNNFQYHTTHDHGSSNKIFSGYGFYFLKIRIILTLKLGIIIWSLPQGKAWYYYLESTARESLVLFWSLPQGKAWYYYFESTARESLVLLF
jgi:hypothetical protein